MIEFATLFLGLVLGPQQVEFLAHESVAAIEVSLDHEVVGHLHQPPWRLDVNLGDELEPHVLAAVAYSSSGSELDRVAQWINTFTEQTEISILVSPRRGGRGFQAQITWESLTEQVEPEAIRVELDGQPLEVQSPRQFDLPSIDPDQTHLLRVELRFSETLQATSEAVFGGPYSDQVDTELTALPILLDGRKKLPSLAEMQDWFSGSGQRLRVRAVEDGPAEVVAVRDLATIAVFREHHELTRKSRRWEMPMRWERSDGVEASLDALLKKDHELRFISPVARQIERQGFRYQIFPPSARFSRQDGGLSWLFATTLPPSADRKQQRLTDAIAVAGMAAARSGRRRVVLLIVGPDPVDQSQLEPSAALGFLRRLRVPIVVWTPVWGAEKIGAWGPTVLISDRQNLVRAYSALSKQLDRQRIVWLDGLHLPQAISLSPQAEGIRLVE